LDFVFELLKQQSVIYEWNAGSALDVNITAGFIFKQGPSGRRFGEDGDVVRIAHERQSSLFKLIPITELNPVVGTSGPRCGAFYTLS